jgi:putative NADH-flavin reductase
LVAEGGPALAETDSFPADYKAEADEMASVLEDLRASDAALDWFFVSPAASFGAWVPGEATGTYRIGGDVLLVDADGNSNISGADLADAVVTEIEQPRHVRARFTVAY